jgi:hypothetical protein
MRKFGLTLSVAASLAVAAIIASCSSDSSPIVSPEETDPSAATSSLNGGGWTPQVEAAANNDGKVAVCHSGNGKNFVAITVSPQGARAHLGDPATGKGGHAADFRISNLTSCPPSSTPGQLQVCKVAGTGVNVGTNFTFAVSANGATNNTTVAAGAAPSGTCANAGSFPTGTTVTVTEGAQTGVNTSSITVNPAGAQQGTSDLPNRRATVITGSGTTTVTFTNTTATAGGGNGTLVVCKVAGTGVTAGGNYTFNVGGQNVTVAAGAGPTGTCSSPVTLAAGAISVSENTVAGTVVEIITGTPAPTNVNLANRSATVQVTQGQQSTITFTNAAASSANTGTLVICKVAGSGVNTGTNFTFSYSGLSTTVAAGAGPTGTCSSPQQVAPGMLTITENSVVGTVPTAITGTPNPTNVSLAMRSATIQITQGQQSTITFTNAGVTTANTGTLVICKVGGTGVTAGTNFTFGFAGFTLTVAAGAGPNGTCSSPTQLAPGALVVTENASAGTSVSSITGTPSAPTNVSLPARSATVQIVTGQETRITFTNTAP